MKKKIIIMVLISSAIFLSGCTEKSSYEDELEHYIAECGERWELDRPFIAISYNYTETIQGYVNNATFHLDVAEFLLNAGDCGNATIELVLCEENRSNAGDKLNDFDKWRQSLCYGDSNCSVAVVNDIYHDVMESNDKVCIVIIRLEHYLEIVDVLLQYQM